MSQITIAGDTSGSITIAAPAAAGTGTLTLPTGTSTLITTSSTDTLTNKTFTTPSLTSASLGTASAGLIEYDGKVPYVTPQSTQRGVIPGMQFYRLDSALVGSNVNTAQNILGVGCTLSSSTVYAFEIQTTLLKTAGITSHTVSFGYGGTATVNNIYSDIRVIFFAGSVNTYLGSSNFQAVVSTQTSTVATTAASNQATLLHSMTIKGTVSVNAGGTFIPQYTLSAAPGGAYSTQIGSYMLVYPIGASGAATSVGTWA